MYRLVFIRRCNANLTRGRGTSRISQAGAECRIFLGKGACDEYGKGGHRYTLVWYVRPVSTEGRPRIRQLRARCEPVLGLQDLCGPGSRHPKREPGLWSGLWLERRVVYGYPPLALALWRDASRSFRPLHTPWRHVLPGSLREAVPSFAESAADAASSWRLRWSPHRRRARFRSRRLPSRRNEMVVKGKGDSLGTAGGSQLRADAASMEFDRCGRDHQLLGNLQVRHSFG